VALPAYAVPVRTESSRRPAAVVLGIGVVVFGLCVAMVAVPALRVRLIVALGGVACTEQQCPSDAGWVSPVDAPVTSQFRSAERPDHHGVDMAAPHGTPVVAASAGLVILAECDARINGEAYGCEQDGSAEVRGCGWHLQVLHADRLATLYCHLQQAPEVSVGDTVTTGQLIGYVGSTGNSSEPHLHFEVQEGELFTRPSPATAVDPETFYANQGIALG
jgi:murein DD-endopeptidase MepM/ murein hydrolase activator NlpD